DVKPVALTDTCEYHHLGIVMSGRLRFLTPDGLEMEVGPGMIFEVQPGHDAWVLGDEACVIYDFAGMRTFGRPLVGSGHRILATIVCTDIVDSTAMAVRLGDAGWRDLIAEQTSAIRRELDRFHGREATTTGDGILATFDGAERAVNCAVAPRGAGHQPGWRDPRCVFGSRGCAAHRGPHRGSGTDDRQHTRDRRAHGYPNRIDCRQRADPGLRNDLRAARRDEPAVCELRVPRPEGDSSPRRTVAIGLGLNGRLAPSEGRVHRRRRLDQNRSLDLSPAENAKPSD